MACDLEGQGLIASGFKPQGAPNLTVNTVCFVDAF
jgi:hypothetical protein